MITLDFLADLAALAYSSSWSWPFDVVFPVLPSESAIILGGVSVPGPAPVPLLLCEAAGAVAGDHLSYSIGRWTRQGGCSPPRAGRADAGQAEQLQVWAGTQLQRRGPSLLVVARFIPGGRTASTFMAGRTAYPLRRFTPVTAFAGLLWASFATMLGYIGGEAFHDQTLLATGLGILIAAGFAALVELVMSRIDGRNGGGATAPEEDGPTTGSGDLAA